MSNSDQDQLRTELAQIKIELEQLKLKTKQAKADRKLLFAVSVLVMLSLLSIKFELQFQDGKTTGSISSSEFGATFDKAMQLLSAIGVIGAGVYAAPAALKSAQLRDSRISSQPTIHSEETK